MHIHEFRLDNGFHALLVPRRALPVVATTLWYQVGSRDERTGETGLSHFLEHMMFKGTDRYAKGQIDLQTAKLGGSNNAYTSADVTAYYFSLASDRWTTALEIEANRMQNCLLDDAEFAAEKNVVLEELAMGEDEPWHQLYHAIDGLVYQVHPYHHPVIGWREDLERLGVDRMRDYYRRHYGPNRALLVAVGDFDAVAAEARVRELFTPLSPSAVTRDEVLVEPPQKGERRAVIRFPGELTRVALAARTCRMGEDDDFALDVVSTILGGGKSSRLYLRLVLGDRAASSISANNETRRDPGMFYVTAELIPGHAPERVEAAIREEIERLADVGPTRAELERARTQLRSGFLFGQETVLDVALRLGRFETMAVGGHRLIDTVLERYDRVDAAEVRNVIRKYLRDDTWNVVWSLPEVPKAARSNRPTRAKKPRAKKTRAKKTTARKAKPARATRAGGRR